ncbi:MAG: glycosyltransferase family 4 protein, partial [Actinobacteria bacterium]|nr:glycosyltransferase family 4 protein [Actinomycetota bacterium]
MRVAYYSPLPPQRSGIADYSALLLPALRQRLDVAVARPRTRRIGRTDIAIYHVGNHPEAHGWIVDALRRRPGVVVLHDLVLHHLVAGLTLARGNAGAYIAAMERDGGAEARQLAEDVAAGRVQAPWETIPERYPLAGEILDHATGLIVHSHYTERGARAEGYAGRIWRIPLAAAPVPDEPAADIPGSPVFGSFGHVNPAKRIPQLLRAFARVRESRPEAKLVLAGAVAPGFELERRIEGLGLEDAVVREGYVDDRRLWALMAACDVIVSLRAPSMGETSAAALQALALGKPLVVSDLGWFAELPDGVARRIPVGGREIDVLADVLEELSANEGLRREMGAAAVEYVRTEHDLERVADLYLAAVEWAVGGEAVADAVFAEVAQAAAEVEIGPDSPELVAI